MQCAFALLLANLLVVAGRTVNYCGAKMCGHTNAHTLCQYHPGPSHNCVGYIEAQLTPEEKVRIVARLNKRRSEAASGRLRHLPTAGNMLKLRWVEELAREAQRWADQCRPPRTPDERDVCRDLFSVTVGQCVASVVGEAPGLLVESMVDLWYMQNMLYKENITSYVVPLSKVNNYGDFAQMIWARSYMVGCGRSRFMVDWNGRLRSVERLVCNLSPRGPPAGHPLWAPAPPGAACPPRSIQDPNLPALCNFQADIDVSTDIDGAMTLEEHVLLSSVLEIENEESLNYLGSLDELYLTKLAIVTMENTVTKALSYYNPVHKRDILDTLSLADQVFTADSNYMNNETNLLINATLSDKHEASSVGPQIIYRKVKIIGRPKTYNLEELNDATVESTSDETNHHDSTEQAFPKVDPDIYMDYYETSNTLLINTTSIPEPSSKSFEDITQNVMEVNSSATFVDAPLNTESINGHIIDHENSEIPDYSRTSDIVETPISTGIYNNSTKAAANESLAANEFLTTRSDDDYFTDPETVQEIQKALQRMERSLEEPPLPSKQSSVKVRRALKDPPNYIDDETTNDRQKYDDPDYGRNQQNLPVEQIENNDSKNKQPMLNMVLKYLPYLKPYEKEILGTDKSACSTTMFTQMLLSFDVALIYFRIAL